MSTLSKLEQMWTRDRRYTARYMLLFVGCFFIHTVMASLFLISGRVGLALFDALSLILYLLWLVSFTRRRIDVPMLLFLYLDAVVHAGVCNVVLGKDCGFFLYPFIIIPITFFLWTHDMKRRFPILNSVVLSLISVLTMLATLRVPPTAPLEDPRFTEIFFQINILLCALLLSVWTSEFISENMVSQDPLSFHAENDPLTGLRNRYGFDREVEQLQGTRYTVILCDLDDFKRINDLYGHDVGDVLLGRIGRTMLASVRKEDILCRWGGEEFLMVLQSDLDTACSVVERVRRKVSAVAAEAGSTTVGVTMTFGAAESTEADNFEELVRIAEANLARGKRVGKNCLMISSKSGEVASPIPRELDTTSLTDRLFDALCVTSDTTYIFVCNLHTNVSRWSRTAVDYFGLPSEFMYDAGNIWLGFVHPDDREDYARDLEAVVSGRKHFHDVRYRARNRDGEYILLTCKGVIIEGDAGNPPMFAGTITNLGIAAPDGKKR